MKRLITILRAWAGDDILRQMKAQRLIASADFRRLARRL